MRINAVLNRKDNLIHTTPCRISEVVTLPYRDFQLFKNNLMVEHTFIRERSEMMGVNGAGEWECVLVIGEGQNDGILVHSSGYGYARYSSYVPNAKDIIQAEELRESLENNPTMEQSM